MRAVRAAAHRIERGEGRRPRGGELREQRRKDGVGQRADARQRAEVGGQRQALAAGLLDARGHAVVDVDVGAPETEDRLLGIADDEQGAGAERKSERIQSRANTLLSRVLLHRFVCREHQEDLRLDGIRVLELVDEQPAVLGLQRAADVRALAQHPRGHPQQVHVVHRVLPAAHLRIVAPRLDQHRHRQAVDVSVPVGEERRDDVCPECRRRAP